MKLDWMKLLKERIEQNKRIEELVHENMSLAVELERTVDKAEKRLDAMLEADERAKKGHDDDSR